MAGIGIDDGLQHLRMHAGVRVAGKTTLPFWLQVSSPLDGFDGLALCGMYSLFIRPMQT